MTLHVRGASEDTNRLPAEQAAEADVVLEEVIDASLYTDRAHHDELGRTAESAEPDHHPDEAPPSPREQPAAPLDIQNIDE